MTWSQELKHNVTDIARLQKQLGLSDSETKQLQELCTHFPREASEMFHSTNSAQNPAFCGLWVHSLKTSDKVLKYGENNRVDFSEHPTVVKRGSVRTINIYAAVPDVA